MWVKGSGGDIGTLNSVLELQDYIQKDCEI